MNVSKKVEGQFMSMVLKTHSVNFLSLAAEVCDSSCSRWLSSQSLLICVWSLSFSSRSWRGHRGERKVFSHPTTVAKINLHQHESLGDIKQEFMFTQM